MPRKPKVGRPKLPKGEAKGRIVPVRFRAEDLKAMERAARKSGRAHSAYEGVPHGMRGEVPGADGEVVSR